MIDEPTRQEEERWCAEQRRNVVSYLQKEGFADPRVGEWPAWHVAPIISVWAVESIERPGWVGWWAVSGDFPTDYTTCEKERHPRQALRGIALRWEDGASRWLHGEKAEGWSVSSAREEEELAPLLATRAKLFLSFADDDSNWLD